MLYAVMVALVWLVTRPYSPALAQSSPTDSAYWRYSAARRLTHVIPADMNGDGVMELLLAAENGRVDLLNAHNALLHWSYTAAAPVLALHPINSDSADHPLLETALVTADRQLILLNEQGEESWRVPLTFTASDNPLPTVRQLMPYDTDGDGRDEILVLFDNGLLHLYDQTGHLLRRLDDHTSASGDTGPQMQIGDVNGDGRDEILLGLFNPSKRFSELFLFDADGQTL
ncbi:MAG TPA: FG-GAP-like repeat-containing protein, partial [Chloroflexota bacterium]|nr:FG-GAP-like repeat-containing protein [Chloroflexota bacterium]